MEVRKKIYNFEKESKINSLKNISYETPMIQKSHIGQKIKAIQIVNMQCGKCLAFLKLNANGGYKLSF